MVSRAEIDRLRTEADTIFTRLQTVRESLERARSSEGDHWERGAVDVDLETPAGEDITVTLDLERPAAESAQARYEQAAEMAERLESRQAVAGPLAAVPRDPLAVLVLFHLEDGSDSPRRVAGALDADPEAVADTCDRLERAGLLAVADRTYRLTDAGVDLLAHLDTREGRERFLRWLDDADTLARRLWRGGPDYARMTAEELDMDWTRVERLYAAMEHVGLVEPYDGSIIKGEERKLKPKRETHRHHTYYVTTRAADRILRDLED